MAKRLFRIAEAAAGKGLEEIEKRINDGATFLDKEIDELEKKLGIGSNSNGQSGSHEAGAAKPSSQLDEDLEIFKLKKGASWEDIKKAYRREAKKYHSDRHNGDEKKAAVAHEIMLIYNSAYERLKKVYGKK